MSLEPIVGEDGVYVISLRERIPSQVPPLDAIRPRVIEDYRNEEARKAASQAGEVFYAGLTNRMAEGTSFEAAALEGQVAPVQVPPFTLSSRSLPGWDGRLDIGALQGAVRDLQVGRVSDLLPTRDGRAVVYLEARKPVDEARLKAELPEFSEQLRSARERTAFNEWFRQQMEMARITGMRSSSGSN